MSNGYPMDIHWTGGTIPSGQRILMANLDMSENLGLQVSVAPMESLVSHTYRKKMGDFQVRNCLNTSLVSPTFAHTICVYAV